MNRGIVVVLLLASVLAFANGYRRHTHKPMHTLSKAEKDCVKDAGVDYNFVSRYVNHPKKLLHNKKTMCYMYCIMKKNKTINDDLSFNKKKFLKKIKGKYNKNYYELIASTLDFCLDLNGYSTCDDAVKRIMCIHNDPLLRTVKEFQNTGLSRPL